jgi:uncharacterized Zn-binding protein involved in type VI secretion
MGDRIMGSCSLHVVPGPNNVAMPSPAPLPFSAPLLTGVANTVLIGGKPAAVQGSSGYNTPPHVGLHTTDPYFVPTMQTGRVVVGSATVLFEGNGAAYTGCTVSQCAQLPGNLVGSATTVLVGS